MRAGAALKKPFLGFIYSCGKHSTPQILADAGEVTLFIKANLYEEELVITDSSDRLILRAVSGVDLYSDLRELGIDLPKLYRECRQGLMPNETTGEDLREDWEVYYDSIGLSPGEIRMRQRVKQACKAAHTVADVIELLEGTYFDVRFISEDHLKTWNNFDPETCLVRENEVIEKDGYSDQLNRALTVDPDARVKHHSSREDVHIFFLLDPPAE